MKRSNILIVVFALFLLPVVGCKKKQKTVPVAVQQLPSMQASEPVVVPMVTKEEPLPPAPQSTVEIPPVVEPPKSTPKPKSTTTHKDAGSNGETTIAKNIPPKILIEPAIVPGTSGAVAAGVSHGEVAHDLQTTDQLIKSAEKNLKAIKRTLSKEEQAVVGQIKAFLAQSKEAAATHDQVRAHNLALKAHLLSDDLVK